MTERNGRLGLWIAGGVVAVAVVVGVVGLVMPRGGAGPAPTGAPGATQPPQSDGCNPVTNDSYDVPDDLRWEAANGVTWPVSDSLGPTATKDGFAVCFAHSPVGAALAATMTIYATVEHDFFDALKFYTADSPGKTKVLEAADSIDPVDLATQLESNGMTFVGFQVREYEAARAEVYLVYSAASTVTGYRGVPRTMVWVDGDWRLKLDDTGSPGEYTDIRSADFVRWAD